MASSKLNAKIDDRHMSPPLAPGEDEIVIDDPKFAAECAALVLHSDSRPYQRLCTAIVTRSEMWGRVWRADLEYSEPTRLPFIFRQICWQSPEGHPRVWSQQPEAPLFPEELTLPTPEQIATYEAGHARVNWLAPKIQEILRAGWAPIVALEAANPGTAIGLASVLAWAVAEGRVPESIAAILSREAIEHLCSAGDEQQTRAVAEAIAHLEVPPISTNSAS